MSVTPIPEGYPRLTPYLIVEGGDDAVAFYCEVFGFTERMRLPGPDDTVGHAELELGDSLMMIADAMPDMGFHAPNKNSVGTSQTLYTEDVDAVFAEALERGAVEISAVETKFFGDRAGQLRDPWGHVWTIMTRVEEISEEEIARRMQDLE